jgi:hypothetical protein
MQRAAVIALLALVACANAQLFQQNYDFRGSLQYRPVGGNIDGSIPFAGELAYLPPPEFAQALRFSALYTQTVRPAENWIVAVDARTGAFAEAQVDLLNSYLIVAAVSGDSMYREGDIVIVNSPSPAAAEGPCFGVGTALALNSPLPHSFHSAFGTGAPLAGATSCLIPEASIIAKLDFKASRSEAAALGFENFRFVRRDSTIFGPTVF